MGLWKTCGSQQDAALMQCMTKYVALDVHQANTVASEVVPALLLFRPFTDDPDAIGDKHRCQQHCSRQIHNLNSIRNADQEYTHQEQDALPTWNGSCAE